MRARKAHQRRAYKRLSILQPACLSVIAALFVSFGALTLQSNTTHAQTTAAQADDAQCVAEDRMSFVRGRGLRWHRQPEIVILGQQDDFRLQDTRNAIGYWNQQLEEMGSGLRLGPVRFVSDLTADDDAYASYLSKFLLERRPGLPDLPPQKFRSYCGSIVIVLADAKFISFGRFITRYGISFIGIKGGEHYPFNLPNVSRNIIAHEIGHGIGLRHNLDGTLLM